MWIPIAAVILTPSFLYRGRHLSSDDANLYHDLILPRASKPNRHSRDLLHTTWPLLIFCIMEIHRLGPGSNPQHWVLKASDKPTTPPSRHSRNIRKEQKSSAKMKF
ncbi:hypothetical protein TNCV_447541 [Trichonephila clavipes]|nr:hypothetical protein TNCV_447541 [Trichonephila clavipes]